MRYYGSYRQSFYVPQACATDTIQGVLKPHIQLCGPTDVSALLEYY